MANIDVRRRSPSPYAELVAAQDCVQQTAVQQAATQGEALPSVRRVVCNQKTDIRRLYEALSTFSSAPDLSDQARRFLDHQLKRSAQLACEIPLSPESLLDWTRAASLRTSQAYSDYLKQRHEGAPRRYFTNRSHALFFLKHVAPTKLVDGAWLYGFLPHWQDVRVRPLVQTYLEELGDGVAAQNHVVIYQKLLADNGCDDLSEMDDAYFIQGVQQLALGQLGSEYLPEALGYNLGYEQLPLHLLITTYELSELGIDPYYFQLHVTIDNADTGHARKAVQALLSLMPVVGDRADFQRRVARGFGLNELGMSSTKVIASFDLERELLHVLERKREVAQHVHSDYARIGGLTVNQWLSERGRMLEFLTALQSQRWIIRNQDPTKSRFWQLISGERAAMFGVFDQYGQQLLYDWIAGNWTGGSARPARHIEPLVASAPRDHIDDETTLLSRQLERLPAAHRATRLIEMMSPASHFTPAGLLATRLFKSQLQYAGHS